VESDVTQDCYSPGEKKKHVSVDPYNQTTLEPRLHTIREQTMAIISGLCQIQRWRRVVIRPTHPVSDRASIDIHPYLRQRACIRSGPPRSSSKCSCALIFNFWVSWGSLPRKSPLVLGSGVVCISVWAVRISC